MKKGLIAVLASLVMFGCASTSDNGGDVELLINGDFASGGEMWQLQNHESGEGTVEYADGVAKITIIKPGGKSWNVQLLQQPFRLEKGANYQVTFDIKASKPRNIGSNVAMSGGTWESYNDDLHFDIGTEFQTITYKFKMQGGTDPKSRIEFNTGADTGTVSIKNVSLVQLN